jgi:hypothetical protein
LAIALFYVFFFLLKFFSFFIWTQETNTQVALRDCLLIYLFAFWPIDKQSLRKTQQKSPQFCFVSSFFQIQFRMLLHLNIYFLIKIFMNCISLRIKTFYLYCFSSLNYFSFINIILSLRRFRIGLINVHSMCWNIFFFP